MKSSIKTQWLVLNVIYFVIILFTPFSNFASPPAVIPAELYQAYTFNGLIPVRYWYFNNSYPNDDPIKYEYEEIENYIGEAKARYIGRYGMTDDCLYQALDKYQSFIIDKDVAIMGSVVPWYESMLLAYGAHPTTIEYNKILNFHPNLKVFTVNEFEANPRLFDAVLSISSFEHDGLGRYGDPLNPNGDLIAMEKVKKILKEDGLLFLSVPVGKDCLVWNAHRVYGHLRLKTLLKGWTIVGHFGIVPSDLDKDAYGGDFQPIFVLKPKR